MSSKDTAQPLERNFSSLTLVDQHHSEISGALNQCSPTSLKSLQSVKTVELQARNINEMAKYADSCPDSSEGSTLSEPAFQQCSLSEEGDTHTLDSASSANQLTFQSFKAETTDVFAGLREKPLQRLQHELLHSALETRLLIANYFMTVFHEIPTNQQTRCLDLIVKSLNRYGLRGHVEAQYLLGRIYMDFESRVNHSKAYHWFSLASKNDHSDSLYHLGTCFEEGKGTSVNITRAIHSYRKACVGNHPGAMYRLAMALMRGEMGQTKNIRDGLKWLRLSAKYANRDHPLGLYELAMLHDKGVANFVWPDHAYLVDLLERAAFLGHLKSIFKLGEANGYGLFGLSVNPEQSFMYYNLAANMGHEESMFELAGWYLTGCHDEKYDFQLEKSEREAFFWMKKAADLDFPKGMFALAYFYENGIGTPQDMALAIECYEKAAAAGDSKALQWVQQNKDKLQRKMTLLLKKSKKSENCKMM